MKINKNLFTIQDEEFHLAVLHMGHDIRTLSHFHDFFEFVFVDKGFSMHRVNGNTSLILPGDVFYIVPGVSHEYWKSINNSVYNCLFYLDVLGEDLDELVKLPMLDRVLCGKDEIGWSKIYLKPYDRFEVLGLLKKIELEINKKQPGWKLRAKAGLIDFLVCLSRIWSEGGGCQASSETAPATAIGGIVHFLEHPAKDKISIEEFASASGYSPDHFSRIFKKLTGLSPSAYLTSMRIAAAAEKLLDPEMTISMAAESAGFEDINYFSRLFKKETGKTPSEFREMTSILNK